jgi:hypothetical protein
MRWFCLALLAVGCEREPEPDDTVDSPPVDTTDDTDSDSVDTPPDSGDTVETDTDPETDAPPAPDCEIGTGELAFEPLTDGAIVESTRGPQGGQHVWGSVRCTGIVAGDNDNPLDPNNPIVDFWIEQDGAQVGGYRNLPRPMQREWGTGLLGDQLVFWVNDYWDTVDIDIVLRFHVRDVNGVEIERSYALRTRADPSMGEPPADTDLPGGG